MPKKLLITSLALITITLVLVLSWGPLQLYLLDQQLKTGTLKERQEAAKKLNTPDLKYIVINLQQPEYLNSVYKDNTSWIKASWKIDLATIDFKTTEMGRESIMYWDGDDWQMYTQWEMNLLPDHKVEKYRKEGKSEYELALDLGKYDHSPEIVDIKDFIKDHLKKKEEGNPLKTLDHGGIRNGILLVRLRKIPTQ